MKVDEAVIEKVLRYRRSKGQRGMILNHDKKTDDLIDWKLVYDRKLM